MSKGDTHPPRNGNNDKSQMEENDYNFHFKDYSIEDYLVLIVFWVLAAVVFTQFFTRYFLNSSIAWTEEMARYLLIATGFMGSVMAVRKRSHIYVEVFYRFLPPILGRIMSTMVDIISIMFFGVGMYLSIRIMPIMARQTMTALPFPMSYIYIPVLVGFVIMTIRSVQVAWGHWKSGYIPVINDSDNPLPEEID